MDAMRRLPQELMACHDLSTEQTIRACYDCSLCLTTLDLGEDRFILCQTIIARCLPYLDAVSPKLATNVVCQMSLQYDLRGRPLTPDSLRAYRKTYIVAHLRAWEKLASAIDPTWKPDDPANMVGSVRPPGGKYANPVAPEDIKEPEIRRQYEAVLEANQRKGDRNVQQRQARQLKESYLSRLKDAILAAHRLGPASKDEREDLTACLRVYVSDASIRAELLALMSGPGS
jgi:hypothetical protein